MNHSIAAAIVGRPATADRLIRANIPSFAYLIAERGRLETEGVRGVVAATLLDRPAIFPRIVASVPGSDDRHAGSG